MTKMASALVWPQVNRGLLPDPGEMGPGSSPHRHKDVREPQTVRMAASAPDIIPCPLPWAGQSIINIGSRVLPKGLSHVRKSAAAPLPCTAKILEAPPPPCGTLEREGRKGQIRTLHLLAKNLPYRT